MNLGGRNGTDVNAANLRSAERLVAIEMGIEPDNNASLTYEQRTEFSQKLAAKILEFPDRFTPETLETARRVAGKTYDPLTDPSFDWQQFASEAGENVVEIGDSVADVGRGAKAALSSAKWLLPVALVLAVGIGLVALNRRLGGAAR